jgi:HIRAN domain
LLRFRRKVSTGSTRRRSRESQGGSCRQVATPPGAPPATIRHGQAPHGRPIEAWSAVVTQRNVVGESHHVDSFKTLLRQYGHTGVGDYGVELTDAHVALVHEPDNPYGFEAVAVWVDAKHHVGYLPRSDAAQYAPKLDSLGYGAYLMAPARVWIGLDGEGKTYGSVTVRVPEPQGILPFNDLPDEPFTVLPSGTAIQVQGEEAHMDVLRGFALGSSTRHVAATLHVVETQKTPSSVKQSLVEVRLDGERVGVLTKAMSDQVRDLVTFVTDCGRVPVARAVVKGSTLRADVVLHVARAVDVGQRWLDSAAPATG